MTRGTAFLSLLASAVAVTASGSAWAQATAPQAPIGRAYSSVGTGLERDLPPRELVPDAAALPNGAAEGHPADVGVHDSKLGLIYVSTAGWTLYAMKVSGLRYRGEAASYCTGPCAATWKALSAPADAKPIGAWKVVTGVQGPQWAYGNWPVFTYRGDTAPGDLKGHEFEDMFLAINAIPPVPIVNAPGSVAPVFVGHREYVLADVTSGPLYSYSGPADCGALCDRLIPLSAPMGSRDIGDWKVVRDEDGARWSYRGRAVFTAKEKSGEVLDMAAVLRPS